MKHRASLEALVPLKRGLSREEAAFIVGVSTDLFDKMVYDKRLPEPARFNGRVVWDRIQLDRALDRLFGGVISNKEVVSPWANPSA
jgi:hypothetical protein